MYAIFLRTDEGSFQLGLGNFFSSAWRTLKLTRKSDKEEFMLYLKLVVLGFGLVGAIGFIIYFVASTLMLFAGIANTGTP